MVRARFFLESNGIIKASDSFGSFYCRAPKSRSITRSSVSDKKALLRWAARIAKFKSTPNGFSAFMALRECQRSHFRCRIPARAQTKNFPSNFLIETSIKIWTPIVDWLRRARSLGQKFWHLTIEKSRSTLWQPHETNKNFWWTLIARYAEEEFYFFVLFWLENFFESEKSRNERRTASSRNYSTLICTSALRWGRVEDVQVLCESDFWRRFNCSFARHTDVLLRRVQQFASHILLLNAQIANGGERGETKKKMLF